MTILRLTRTGVTTPEGLERLRLDRVTDGVVQDSLRVCSGQPGRQHFRTAEEGRSGSMEPIPEGRYRIGKPEWAGGVGDYSASWGSGLGPVWMSLAPQQDMDRGDFGFHLDSNHGTAPGSAGCVVFWTLPDLRTLLSWQSENEAAQELVVDWGLGTVQDQSPPAIRRWKLYAQPDKARGFHDAEEVRHGHVEAWLNQGRAAVNVNGKAMPIASLTIELAYRAE